MKNELDAQLRHAAVGHGLITKIGHAGDVMAGYARLIALTEKRKRGVRFLPAQVIKRAMRIKLHSIRVEDPPESVFAISKHQG